MSEALKVSKFTPKAPRIHTELVNPPQKLIMQAHSLEGAGSDFHCCTGQLNIKSTAQMQNKICLLNQKSKYTLENITTHSLLHPELCYSLPLPFSEPRLQPFCSENSGGGKEIHPWVCSAQSRDPGESHSPIFPTSGTASSRLASELPK